MLTTYTILTKTHKKILEKSVTFLLILVLIWQFSFPRVTSHAFFSPDLEFIFDKANEELIEVRVLTQEEKMVQIMSEVARQEQYDNPELLIAIARAESRFDPNVRGEQDPRDRGLFQINSYYNPQVTDECAFDPWCSSRWTVQELQEGRAWKWNASRYKWGRNITRN